MSDQALTLRVSEVKDGDTIVAEGSDGDALTVRVWGIDAPETSQPYGPAATKAARHLVGGQRVTLHVEDTGPYGRLIARVRDGRVDLARSLVVSGYAWHSRKYGTSEELKELEAKAREEGAGLWSQTDPTPPWRHRGEDEEPEVDVLEAAKTGWSWAGWVWRVLS
jgi:micrococcal nuclease